MLETIVHYAPVIFGGICSVAALVGLAERIINARRKRNPRPPPL